MKHLTSRQNPLVGRYRAVAEGRDHSCLLVDGVHLVADALRARLPLSEAVVRLSAIEDGNNAELVALVARLQAAGLDISTASPGVMDALSPVRSSSPIVALAARPSTAPDAVFDVTPALVVGAVDVQDPGNVGAIIRVAEAGGATGVAVAGQSADPFGWKALRGAMGSAFRLPLLHPCDPEALLADARRHGCRIVATVPRGGTPPDAVDLTVPSLILVGGEGPGLPADVMATADCRVSLPMTAPVESLNTAICAALLVYEARRQRVGHAVPHRS